MAYSVALRIGLLSSCYWHSGWPIVYPRGVSGNDGWLNNDDIIQMIDYCNNSSGLGFREIQEIIEFKEVESGAITVYFDGIASGYNPSWTWSYGCWFGEPCCSKGIPASKLVRNATVEARVFFGSPVNMWSEPARITFGDPSKRAQFESVSAHWETRTKLIVEVTGKNLDAETDWVEIYDEAGKSLGFGSGLNKDAPTGQFHVDNPPPVMHLFLRKYGVAYTYTDVTTIEVPPFACEDLTEYSKCIDSGCYYYGAACHTDPECINGETKCENYDLHECVNNKWEVKERQSPACDYVKRSSPCPPYGDLDDDGYVTYNDLLLVVDYVGYGWNAVKNETPLSEEEFRHRADVNSDDKIDMGDAVLIGNYSYYNLDTFPVCSAVFPNFEFVEDECYIQCGDDLFCFAEETKDVLPGTDVWAYFKVKNTGEVPSRLTVKVFDGDTKVCEKSPPDVVQPGESIEFYTFCFKMTEVSRNLVIKVYEYGKTEELDSLGC